MIQEMMLFEGIYDVHIPQPPRRFCKDPECGTVLSIYNKGVYCSLHVALEVFEPKATPMVCTPPPPDSEEVSKAEAEGFTGAMPKAEAMAYAIANRHTMTRASIALKVGWSRTTVDGWCRAHIRQTQMLAAQRESEAA